MSGEEREAVSEGEREVLICTQQFLLQDLTIYESFLGANLSCIAPVRFPAKALKTLNVEPLSSAPNMPSHPLNIAAQTKNHHDLAAHVNDALNNVEKDILETPDVYAGRTAAYWAIQKGSPECLGIMAKAGANLHKACPHIWEIDDPSGFGDGFFIDPSCEDERLKVHHALNQTTLSFVTRTCCECSSNQQLKTCSRCKMARYCSTECQTKNWELHQLVCKRIEAGSDMVTVHKKFPDPSKKNSGGFEPHEDLIEDTIVDSTPENGESNVCWEYYDIETKTWVAYPDELNVSIEDVYSQGTFARYVFRPGCQDAEGVEENPITCSPPSNVSTHSICFSHMIDHQIYSGAGRKIRRQVLENTEPEKQAKTKSRFGCAPLCGAMG